MSKKQQAIYIDYQDALSRANRLSQLADELDRIRKSSLSNISADVHKSWKGESSNLCVEKLERLNRQLEKRAKALRSNANGIKESAERLYRIEQAALILLES